MENFVVYSYAVVELYKMPTSIFHAATPKTFHQSFLGSTITKSPIIFATES